jgi:hypothetical protein
MGEKWRERKLYGNILLKKIRKQNKIFDSLYLEGLTEEGKIDTNKMDMDKLALASRVLDYSMQVQLSNINKMEEMEMEEIMGADIDNQAAISKVEEITVSQRKF